MVAQYGLGALILVMVLGWCGAGVARAQAAEPVNPRLRNLPANQWTPIHQQADGDKVRFKRQAHGGSCYDSLRCRIVLFGSDTHGQDWTNSPLIFDLMTLTWSRVYEDDDPATYRAVGEEAIAVAGEAGDHPWATHTFGTVIYDPQRDEMVVCCWPEHLKPGRFTDAMKDVWDTVKKHPTWTYSFKTSKWTPLPGRPEHFFPYAAVYDSDRNVIVGYGGRGIWELGGEERTWTRIEQRPLTGYHNNAVYGSANKAIVVFGSQENSNDIVAYWPATREHRKMPTPGQRPPKDQHAPMCFDPEAKRVVVVVDEGGSAANPRQGKAQTWLYDLSADAWTPVLSASFPFGCGMNYNMHYDPRHKICVLVTEDYSTRGWPVTVYALRIDLSALE